MSTSARRAALTDLVTALGTITVANGYTNTVQAVAMRAFEWETVHADFALPAIGVVPGAVQYEMISNNIMVANQTVSIEFCYAAATQDQAWDVGDSLIDDIIGAALVDPTRGGNAMHTLIQAAETDAGNPDIMDSRGGTAAGILTAQIRLSRAWAVSP